MTSFASSLFRRAVVLQLALWTMVAAGATPLIARQTSSLTGVVTRSWDGKPLGGVDVTVVGGTLAAVTAEDGGYRLSGLPAGPITVRFGWLGYRPVEASVDLPAGGTRTLDIALDADPIPLGEVRVVSASRQPERVVEAPAAVSVVPATRVRDLVVTGEMPRLLTGLPGVSVVENGVDDYNLNTRGFNAFLNRRLLVLIDGRDQSLPLLGNQEWNGLSILEDGAKVELVRGPGSALYGANAFSGVLNVITPAARQTQGTRIVFGGGELGSLKAYARHAGVSSDLRWGYRVSGSYTSSDNWHQSRTNLGDLASEYAQAVDTSEFDFTVPTPGYEVRPLAGQTKAGDPFLPGPVTGSPDPTRAREGSLRIDRYFEDGSMLTAEAGASFAENHVYATELGRSQVEGSFRSYGQVTWAGPRAHVTTYWTHRDSEDAYSLATGGQTADESHALHLEAQANRPFAAERGRLVLGGSLRNVWLDTKGTIMAPESDQRSDAQYSVFGQVDFDLADRLRLVAAARVDGGDLYDAEVSPKVALVFTPTENQSLRVTLNRAFLLPSALQRFLSVAVAPPADLSFIDGIFQLPAGTVFGNSTAVPFLALGNENLKPEKVTSWEVGYKAQSESGTFFAADAYYSQLEDFTSGSLPGVNSAFPTWRASDQLPPSLAAIIEANLPQIFASVPGLGSLYPALTRLPDGSSAFVFSPANSGSATEWGVEVSVGVRVTERLGLEANVTHYSFELDDPSFLPGDTINSNTPKYRGNVAATWSEPGGASVRVGLRVTDEYLWRGGLYRGVIPSSQTVDLEASLPWRDDLRFTVVGTNVLDQQRYHVIGGSVIGRRMLAMITWTP